MKNACCALIGFLATAAFADLTPNTIIDNVPGDTTLSNLVAASGVKSVEIDPTLSEEGKAADALKVKEALNGKLGTTNDNGVTFNWTDDGGYISLKSEYYGTGIGLSLFSGSGRIVNYAGHGIDPNLIDLPNKGGTLALTSDIPAPVAVIDPAVATTTGKAADALKVKEALAGKQSDLGASVDDTYVVFPYGVKAEGGEVRAMWYEVIDTNARGELDAMGTSDDDPNGEHMHIRTFADPDRSLPSGDIVVPRKNGMMALTSDIPAPYTPPPYLRVYDEVRQCWWRGRMVDGVMNWEVE